MAVTVTSASVLTKPLATLVNVLDRETVTTLLKSDLTRTKTYTSGTGANQINAAWTDTITILTTADTTLDLTALAGGAFGTVAFSKVKEIIIQVATATTGYRILVGGAAENQFSGHLADASDIIRVDAAGQLHLSSPVDGYTVDATHSDLKIENPSGGSVVLDITILGVGTYS